MSVLFRRSALMSCLHLTSRLGCLWLHVAFVRLWLIYLARENNTSSNAQSVMKLRWVLFISQANFIKIISSKMSFQWVHKCISSCMITISLNSTSSKIVEYLYIKIYIDVFHVYISTNHLSISMLQFYSCNYNKTLLDHYLIWLCKTTGLTSLKVLYSLSLVK